MERNFCIKGEDLWKNGNLKKENSQKPSNKDKKDKDKDKGTEGSGKSELNSEKKPKEESKEKDSVKGIDNAIPNFSEAKIDLRKLTDYALNPKHPVGGNKAKVFESALGYNQSNASELMKQIQDKLPNTPATLGKADQYGQRYTVDMLIIGPNGKTATVRTGWIIKSGSNTPEMTTLNYM